MRIAVTYENGQILQHFGHTETFKIDVKCSHHEHNHGEGHTCGEHGCGSHSCH